MIFESTKKSANLYWLEKKKPDKISHALNDNVGVEVMKKWRLKMLF
jgi:hypothetical protein